MPETLQNCVLAPLSLRGARGSGAHNCVSMPQLADACAAGDVAGRAGVGQLRHRDAIVRAGTTSAAEAERRKDAILKRLGHALTRSNRFSRLAEEEL